VSAVIRGKTRDYTLTAYCRSRPSARPYCVTVQVTQSRSPQTPFAIYLVNADLSQHLTLLADVGSSY
jgi:hypothetical protein